MSGRHDKFEHESVQDPESIVKYLTELGEGFKNNALTLGSNESQIVLEPKGMLKFRIEAKRKKDKGKLELSISWREEEAAEAETNGGGHAEAEKGADEEAAKAEKKAAKEAEKAAKDAEKAAKKAAKEAAKAEKAGEPLTIGGGSGA